MIHEIPLHCPSTRPLSRSFLNSHSVFIYPYVSNRSPPVCFLYDAGSNSGYDDNYLRSCVRYLGFYVSLWTGTLGCYYI
jgi:hypothetical protein